MISRTILLVLLIKFVSSQCPWDDVELPEFDPPSNADSEIESGKTYILKKSIDIKGLSISGKLILDNKNINLKAEWIRVNKGGHLIIGTEECKITEKIIITLIGPRNISGNSAGDDPYDFIPFGEKCLVVATDGHLDIHGEIGETWTTLQSTALAGTDSIALSTLPGWSIGDEIIIASTDFGPMYKYDKVKGSLSWAGASEDLEEQSEKRKIINIDKNIITLDKPLKYSHWVNEYYSAEVGLLTRKIVIQGDESSEETFFGGHFLVRHANIRVSGVEFTRMGQLGVLGRYPVHFHLAGDVRDVDAYVKDCSIQDSYQRCLVIHDTHGTLIKNNVAYKTYGHCYFLEDAGERMNVFDHNLGIHAIPVPDELDLQQSLISKSINLNIQLIPTDNSPAIFWITNPNNTFTNNVAVGGRFGFWFLPPLRVRHPSSLNYEYNDPFVRPRSSPLKLFKGNIAHSCSETGLEIDEYLREDDKTESGGFWIAREGPFDPSSEDLSNYKILEIKFEDFTAYKCRSFGVWGKSSMRFTGMKLIDNRVGLMVNGESMVEDSLFVGESDNPGYPWENDTDRQYPSPWGDNSLPIIGHQTFDNGGPQYSRNNTFYNFKSNEKRKAGAIGPLDDGTSLLNTENRVYNLQFDDSNRIYVDLRANDGPYGFNIMDIDGSLTKLNVPAWIINKYALHSINEECIEREQENVYYCPARRGGFVQLRITDRTGKFKLNFDSSKKGPTDRDVSAKVYRLSDGNYTYVRGSTVNCTDGECHRWVQNFETYNAYAIEFVDRQGTYINTPKVIRAEMDSSSHGDWVIMAIPYPKNANLKVKSVQWDDQLIGTLSPVNNICELSRDNFYYNEEYEFLFLLFDNKGPHDGDYTERFGLLDPNNETPYYIVEAEGCGEDGCISTSNKLPIGWNLLNEVYSTDLITCISNRNVESVVGNAYFTFDPREMKASYTINLINPYIYREISLYYEDSSNSTNKIHTKVFPRPTTPLRGVFTLSLQQWNWLHDGKIHIRIIGDDIPDVCGVFSCEGECIQPRKLDSSDPCEPPEGTLTIFGDNIHKDYSIDGWDYNSDNIFKYEISSESMCGTKSILLQSGALMLHELKKPVTISIEEYSHLEFFTKLLTGETVLEVAIRLDNNEDIKHEIGIEYVDNFIVDSNRWTKISIPLEKLKISYAPREITHISIYISEYWNRPPVEIYLDEIRFVKKEEKNSIIKEVREMFMEKCNKIVGNTPVGDAPYNNPQDSYAQQLKLSILVLTMCLIAILY